MYSTAYNLWTFTWFVHFELPFRLKGTDKIHTEGLPKFHSNIHYIFFAHTRYYLKLIVCLISKFEFVTNFRCSDSSPSSFNEENCTISQQNNSKEDAQEFPEQNKEDAQEFPEQNKEDAQEFPEIAFIGTGSSVPNINRYLCLLALIIYKMRSKIGNLLQILLILNYWSWYLLWTLRDLRINAWYHNLSCPLRVRPSPNRLSSTIGGNREMDQLYMTSQVSNITLKTKFSQISWHVFQA